MTLNFAAVQAFHTVTGVLLPPLAARSARRLLMRPRRLAPRDWELPALRTAQRVTFRFGLSGLRWGAAGAPVVLMLHGWEGRASQFAGFVAPLLARGRQVIALDAPAHGHSPGAEAHPVAFAQALLEAAGEIRGLEAVVGHSMGAGALGYALTQGLKAERVVLLGSPATVRAVLQRFAGAIGLAAPARAPFLRLVERHTGVAVDELDLPRAAAQLRLPALIVHDRDDALVPFAEGQAVARAWPGAQLLATRGLGHWRILTDAAVVDRVAAFVAGDGAALRLTGS